MGAPPATGLPLWAVVPRAGHADDHRPEGCFVLLGVVCIYPGDTGRPWCRPCHRLYHDENRDSKKNFLGYSEYLAVEGNMRADFKVPKEIQKLKKETKKLGKGKSKNKGAPKKS